MLLSCPSKRRTARLPCTSTAVGGFEQLRPAVEIEPQRTILATLNFTGGQLRTSTHPETPARAHRLPLDGREGLLDHLETSFASGETRAPARKRRKTMQRSSRTRLISGLFAAAFGFVLLGACSDEEGSNTVGGTGGSAARGGKGGRSGSGVGGSGVGGSGVGGAGATGGSSGAAGGIGKGGGGGVAAATPCEGLPIAPVMPRPTLAAPIRTPAPEAGDGSCAGTAQEAERIDVDLYFMMDRSVSMNEQVAGGMTRWQAMRTALQQLAQSPQAANLRAGIGFFNATGRINDQADCNPALYATPAVPIGTLAQVGPDFLAAIDARSPGGFTPLVPALQGALQYATSWAVANPTRAAAVVLVTDGYPTQCDPLVGQASKAAAEPSRPTPSVRTFVIGIGGVGRVNLENYARSGGTTQPFIVSDTNVVSSFVDTVLNIAASNLACDFGCRLRPLGQQLVADRVQVTYSPAGRGCPKRSHGSTRRATVQER